MSCGFTLICHVGVMLLYHRLECTHFPLEFLHCAVQQPPLVLDVVLHGLELLLLTSLLLEPLLQLFVFAAQLGQVPLEDERSIRVRRSNSWFGSTCVNAANLTCTSSNRVVSARLARDISSSCSLISASDSSSCFLSLC